MSVILSGASDDLVELEGDVYEEFYGSEDGKYVAFSNGVVLKIQYTVGGLWRITPVANCASDIVTITQCPEDDDDNYSDHAEVNADITWVVAGENYARSK